MTRLLPVALVLAVVAVTARPVSAQFEEPCELACIGVLGVSSFVAATGTSVAVGRITGGLQTVNQGLVIWGGTFVTVLGGGMMLSRDGSRQERAVYAAGLGMLGGALAGLVIEGGRTGGDRPRMLAGTLMGAAAGVIAGGIYGALTYEEPVPLLSFSVPL